MQGNVTGCAKVDRKQMSVWRSGIIWTSISGRLCGMGLLVLGVGRLECPGNAAEVG